MSSMESMYSTAKVPSEDGGKPLSLDPDLQGILSHSRDYDQLLWVWKSWRDAIGPQLKPKFAELVENMNNASREYGK